MCVSVESSCCTHGAGPLFHGHTRNTSPPKSDAKQVEKQEEVKVDGEAEGEQNEDLSAGAPVGPEEGASAIFIERLSPEVDKAKLAHDVAHRGQWPVSASAVPCPVLDRDGGPVRWREYVWCSQKFVDRTGKAQEKKIQQFQDRVGTRQEFLSTFKRKILEWLPHKQHLEWDSLWQRLRPQAPTQPETMESVSGDHSLKLQNMPLGEVEVRIDFIKNAELKSPNEAQREYFVHQYMSLLCCVIHWKSLDDRGNPVLRTRTFMFCSDDRKHDGVFAAHCLAYLAKNVRPLLLGLLVFLYVLFATYICLGLITG